MMKFNSARLVLAGAAVLAACGAEPSAKAAPDKKPNRSAAGNVASSTPRSAAADSARKRALVVDSSPIHLNPGRNAHDSASFLSAIRAGRKRCPPMAGRSDPLAGALLPAKRIVAFYGNPLSKKMGVLGEYPVDEMLVEARSGCRLNGRRPTPRRRCSRRCTSSRSSRKARRDAMACIALRMDTALIEKVYGWAQRKNALLFLDIQVGHSTVQAGAPATASRFSRDRTSTSASIPSSRCTTSERASCRRRRSDR